MRICVFCGSSPGRLDTYVEHARVLGRLLGKRGIGLVYGGASVGTMGELADAALAAGAEVVGVIPQQLVDREIAHPALSELYVVSDMHERKARMSALCEGFLALPGGAGTLEELFEVWTWAQLGLHDKPVGLLDVAGYYKPLRAMADHMVAEGFMRPQYRDMVLFDADPEALLDRFGTYEPPKPRWTRSTG